MKKKRVYQALVGGFLVGGIGFFASSLLQAKNPQIYESQPQILFNEEELIDTQESVALEVDFNNAVLHLENGEYLEAITLFKKTAKILKIPSFLNIGIAYYKLDSTNNAYLYLKKIHDFKESAKVDPYSYISANYYLYKITNDKKFITTLFETVEKIPQEKYDENLKALLVDTYILLKDYDKALELALTMTNKDHKKIGVLYIKKDDFEKATLYFDMALGDESDEGTKNQLYWLKLFSSLKMNNLPKIKENIATIESHIGDFETNKQLPIKIYFNPNKYDHTEYLSRVTKFTPNRTIDMIFYFAPFIFIDNKEIYKDATKGYVLKNKTSLESLDMMIDYNKKFLKFAKQDPIVRAMKLQEMVDQKNDGKSYEYYNLGLSYAQNFDFIKAHRYFKKAYELSKSNKLYSAMAMISATRGDIALEKEFAKQIKNNLVSNGGEYKYLGKYVYKLVYDPKYLLDSKGVSLYDRRSIFLRGLDFLEAMQKGELTGRESLLEADMKDPMVYLLRSIVKKQDESQYKYVARLQDTLPKEYNHHFLKGPPLITQYYCEIVKSVGIFHKIPFLIKNETTPSYLRTKATVQLYDGYATSAVAILERLVEEYKLNDIYTYDLLAAAYLASGDESNGLATLGEMQFEYNDGNAKFLNGVQLIQNLKFNTALGLFAQKYDGFFIDFEIEKIDDFLESL